MTKRAAETLFSKAGASVADVDVVELHDCFAANELITYEALGLCPEGKYMWDSDPNGGLWIDLIFAICTDKPTTKKE